MSPKVALERFWEKRYIPPRMQPKISIIVPVYNVEPYLRQCLDSVVNQTLQGIQIICVNDGSTDGSLTILQEYADKDSRIEVIDKPNSGNPGAARNAGLPRVRGKYMYFLDSDDWIDPRLCEKTYYRLESTGADVVFFFYHDIPENGQEKRMADSLTYCRCSATHFTSEHLIANILCVPWNRVIRTSFFQRLGTQFPEVPHEDMYMHWILIANNPKVEIIPEKLNYHRLLGKSLMGQLGEYVANNGQASLLVKKYLQGILKYEQYSDLFLTRKFNRFFDFYHKIRKDIQPDAIRWFRESLDDEEMDFLRTSKTIGSGKRDEILFLLGEKPFSIIRSAQRRLKSLWKSFNKRILRKVTRPIAEIIRACRSIGMLEARIKELSEQLAQRDKIIVQQRNQQEHSEHSAA